MDIDYVDISDKAALFSSELAYCYEYEEAHDFGYMACYPHEELDNEALRAAILEVELSKQYSFYDLAINEADKRFIAGLNITSFSNEVYLWSEVEYTEIKKHYSSFLGIKDSESAILIYAIDHIVRDIVGESKNSDAEVIIRTREAYVGDDCSYWHIDKNRNQSNKEIGLEEQWQFGEKVFLIVLKGEKTDYYDMSKAERREWQELTKETFFYYGHDPELGCQPGDKITYMFQDKVSEIANDWQGSVHKVGIDGALHKEPDKSEAGRMILIITPIYKGVQNDKYTG